MPLEPLESAVVAKLLDGDHPLLTMLRQQVPLLSVKAREFTGGGFFTEFAISGAMRAQLPFGKVCFGDVEARIPGLQHGAGFLLYVDEGLISMLEGYSYEEAWPEDIRHFSLNYLRADRAAELAKLGPIPGV